MIEITAKTVGIWFVKIDEESDWMGALTQTDELGHEFEFEYRFRYYRGDPSKTFEESEDKKNWYGMTAKGTTRSTMLEKIRQGANEMAVAAGTELEEVLNDGAFDEFTRDLQGRNWIRFEVRPIH